MPINLKYGQQAVARGFLTPQRLQQVLTKQRQLAEQGKKVSLRMILEKSKLLSPDQLGQVDRDLNIKVVKKQTGKIDRPAPGPQRGTGPVGAQNFAGEAVPQFSGMTGADPDATVFEPPPPDMQQRIKAEREKAKQAQRAKQEAEAASFFQQNDQSPFGGDPFGGDAMAPEPFGNEMQPEPFGNEMQPEPFGNEMQPEPFGAGDLQPAPMDGFGGDDGFAHDPFASEGAEPELQRMDSSPKLESLAAEHQGFASPDDEELPTLNAGFDNDGYAPPAQQRYGQPQQPQYAPPPRQPQYAPPVPAHSDLAPASGGDFDSFGNDIMSPDDLEAGATGSAAGTKPLGSGADMDRTMFSPPPAAMPSPRQKTGAMDRTVFSPRPPEFGGPQPAPSPEMEPAGDDWGESDVPAAAGFDEEPAPAEAANMDATMFSPPPPELAARSGGTKKPQGRQKGDDDFGNIELPSGKRMDDIPTSPSKGDEVHPLRRGVTGSHAKASSGVHKQPPAPAPQDDYVSDDLPGEEPAHVPDIPDEEPVQRGKSNKLAGKSAKGSPADGGTGPVGKGKLPKKKVPDTVPPEEEDGAKPKKKSSRVVLIFTILLLVVVAVLVLPVVLYEHVEQVRPMRDHPQAKQYYDHVEKVINDVRKLAGLDAPAAKPAAPANTPAETPPDNTPPANAE
ncbi:MAG: hypothetical protein KF754_06410 [Planctomycetes bacterium]|nr:hypothetical protein [Planctomycetota bacterium]